MNNQEIVIVTMSMLSVIIFVAFIVCGLLKTCASLFSDSETGLRPVPPNDIPPCPPCPPPPKYGSRKHLRNEIEALKFLIHDLTKENKGLKGELSTFKADCKKKLLDTHAVKCMILRGTIKLPAEYVDSSESKNIEDLKKNDIVKVAGLNTPGKVIGFNVKNEVIVEFGFSSLSFSRESVRLI